MILPNVSVFYLILLRFAYLVSKISLKFDLLFRLVRQLLILRATVAIWVITLLSQLYPF
jgi:hypothetical protein